MAPMRFGIMGFTTPPYGEIAQRVRTAEEMGFASAWLADDLLTPGSEEMEPWMVLGALARETSRIQFGTLASVPPFRHPSFLAMQALTLDRLSGGRAILGFGGGGAGNNYAAFGHDDWTPRERADRMHEQAAIIAPLLHGQDVNVDGSYYRARTTRAKLAKKLVPVPLIIATQDEKELWTIARYADGWSSLGGQPYPNAHAPVKRLKLEDAVGEMRRLGERLEEICYGIRRNTHSIYRSMLAYRPPFDPLSSLDAFDEFVGRYGEIGIQEIIFFWPPLENLFPRTTQMESGSRSFEAAVPISLRQQRAFERIARDRIERSTAYPAGRVD